MADCQSTANVVKRLPQKKYYRQRAHSNPIADHCLSYPLCPSDIAWTKEIFPNYDHLASPVRFADIGCGYGGLLVNLSSLFPEKKMIGMEIRVKVADYVLDRIHALRSQHAGQYMNIGCIRTNAMKYLPNFFAKGQLEKMFFLFPDPHFKRAKHKWRIISDNLLAEYAYVLAEGGILYTATDVHELHLWMAERLDSHPLFERCSDSEIQADPVVPLLYTSTEESKKVDRTDGSNKWRTVHRRIKDVS